MTKYKKLDTRRCKVPFNWRIKWNLPQYNIYRIVQRIQSKFRYLLFDTLPQALFLLIFNLLKKYLQSINNKTDEVGQNRQQIHDV